jgi:carbonic anhydrase/acetyltransferase-like protein (isoleucine patch superfamily)
MKTKKIAAEKTTKKVSIGALVKTAGNGVEKIDKVLGGLVFDAFPSREYVRHVNSVLNVSAADGEAYYTYVFEVDEAYYRISCGEDCGTCHIGPFDESDDNGVEISLSAKAIREWVESFERKDSGDVADAPKESADPEGKKYEFTGETKEVEGHTLHRIRALRTITDPNVYGWEISAGRTGGWIESEKNLSHEGAAWVNREACVYGDAEVYDNALVDDNAQVSGHVKVYDEAQVYDNAEVGGDAEVFGNARVYSNAEVYGFARVYGDAIVCGSAEVRGTTTLSEGCINEGTHGTPGGKPEEFADPETEDTLKHRMAALEGRFDRLSSEMKATVKDIKKKLHM